MISKGSSCPGLQRNQDVNSFREKSSIDLHVVRMFAPLKILGGKGACYAFVIDNLFDDMILVHL